MLTIYLLLLIAFALICSEFYKLFLKDTEFGSSKSKYNLDLYVEPFIRSFNAFKYKNYNKIYDIKSNESEMCS